MQTAKSRHMGSINSTFAVRRNTYMLRWLRAVKQAKMVNILLLRRYNGNCCECDEGSLILTTVYFAVLQVPDHRAAEWRHNVNIQACFVESLQARVGDKFNLLHHIFIMQLEMFVR